MFNYNEAFKRNQGWVTPDEQEIIRNSTLAIGGLGGVGGDHAITMARMGAQNFHIADLDGYDYSNFNRQAGANMSTVGKSKAEVMEETIRSINPDAKIKNFTNGIQEDNLDEFLDGVDVYLDSLDIFALNIRRRTFEACHEKNIPALTAAPMGMGVAFLSFIPGRGMTFKEYFGMKEADEKYLNTLDDDPVEKYIYKLKLYINNIIRFVTGVAPTVQQRHYLTDKRKVDFFTRDLPSTKMGINLASGSLCTNVLKTLLGRGKVVCAPRGLHFDAYNNKMIKTWMFWGHNNPLLRFVRREVDRQLKINEKIDWIRTSLEKDFVKGELKSAYTEEEMSEMLVSFNDVEDVPMGVGVKIGA